MYIYIYIQGQLGPGYDRTSHNKDMTLIVSCLARQEGDHPSTRSPSHEDFGNKKARWISRQSECGPR